MQLVLMSTSALLRITPTSTASLDWHIDYTDATLSAGAMTGAILPNAVNGTYATASITTILAGIANNARVVKCMTIRNTDAATANTVTVSHNDGTTLVTTLKVTLQPNDTLEFIENIGFFVLAANAFPVHNQSTSTVSAAFASETYLVGSAIALPASYPIVGSRYHLLFDMTKTAAGVATPIIKFYLGTNGSTGDTNIATVTGAIATAAADICYIECFAVFRSVGSGTSAVLEISSKVHSSSGLTTTGLWPSPKYQFTTSAGFNSTTASAILGASFTGGTSFVGTCNQVQAEIIA
jgi:hypothetical protein